MLGAQFLELAWCVEPVPAVAARPAKNPCVTGLGTSGTGGTSLYREVGKIRWSGMK